MLLLKLARLSKQLHLTRAHLAARRGFHSEIKPEIPLPPCLHLIISYRKSECSSQSTVCLTTVLPQFKRHYKKIHIRFSDCVAMDLTARINFTCFFTLTCANVWRCCYCSQVRTLGNILTSWNSFIAPLPGNSPQNYCQASECVIVMNVCK